MAASPAPTLAPGAPSLLAPVGWVTRAALVAIGGGVLLGLWCREAVGGGPVASVLAEVGAPWVAGAFVLGAVAAPGRRSAALVVGALAGGGALVVAALAYYGAWAPSGTVLLRPSAQALAWASTGIVVGAVAGAAGGAWRSGPRATAGAVAVTAVGLAVAAEAVALLRSGAVAAEPGRPVVVALALGGVLAPLLLCPSPRHGAVGALIVALLAIPLSVPLLELGTAVARG